MKILLLMMFILISISSKTSNILENKSQVFESHKIKKMILGEMQKVEEIQIRLIKVYVRIT